MSRPTAPDLAAPATIAWLIEPRFPGGTSFAVAAEWRALRGLARPAIHAFRSRMFGTAPDTPALAEALRDMNLALQDVGGPIGADLVILHNPAFLKFETAPLPPILCRDLVVVTHENFLRPGGAPGFDVAGCLDRLDRATLAARKWLAPVSAINRASLRDWCARHPAPAWRIAPEDWFNICDLPRRPPPERPADRRGRLSRPGAEKFPALDQLDLCFPAHAGANLILGADSLIAARISRPHWQLLPFGALSPARFFDRIDFHVHFTAPTWQESFGRVIAEALAAGRVVLTDPATASGFGPGVIGCAPHEVDAIIAGLIAAPDRYGQMVLDGQAWLDRLSPEAFRARFLRQFPPPGRIAA